MKMMAKYSSSFSWNLPLNLSFCRCIDCFNFESVANLHFYCPNMREEIHSWCHRWTWNHRYVYVFCRVIFSVHIFYVFTYTSWAVGLWMRRAVKKRKKNILSFNFIVDAFSHFDYFRTETATADVILCTLYRNFCHVHFADTIS